MTKFFRCKHCKNLVGKVIDTDAEMLCCGEAMEGLEPNTVEASFEKHLPAVSVVNSVITVNVGDVDHPMEEGHYIEFIYVETKSGGQRKSLKVGEAPQAQFSIIDDEATAVYAYCNLHGLWKTEL